MPRRGQNSRAADKPAIPQCPNLRVVVVVSDYGVSAVECPVPRVFGCGVPSRFNHNQWFETTLAFAEQAHPQPRWQGVHLNVANPYRIVKPAQLPPVYARSAHWFQCVAAYDSAVAISLRAKVPPPKPLGMPERMSFEGEVRRVAFERAAV